MDSHMDSLIFSDNDMLLFKEEDDEEQENAERWKVLIVDDEEEVHNITKLVLSDFKFDDKGLEIIDAYSRKEAQKIMDQNEDIAVIFLDVVMETEDAGLKLIKYIRDILNNKLVRIIMRTGQPGQAPEKNVILNYDINDYKEKTELTAQRLFTTMISSLRGYRDILTINSNNRELQYLNKEIENTQKSWFLH